MSEHEHTTHSITLYRVVSSNPPTRYDFLSHKELGKPLTNPSMERLWSGISCQATESQARQRAKIFPEGHFVAEIHIAKESGIVFERTGRRRGHYTIWGGAYQLRCAYNRMRRHAMDAWFEIWDMDSRNMIADFDTEGEALEFMIRAIDKYGPTSLDSLTLTKEVDGNDPEVIAAGRLLLDRAWATRGQTSGVTIEGSSHILLRDITRIGFRQNAGLAVRMATMLQGTLNQPVQSGLNVSMSGIG